ncbi:hypothetical protein MVLG_04692 [Microbotryum lychnidis-dioicae p1A1 Lamole]|uniref:Uncharacterized protein n=1 Tax=Microbotryum lychnidis-dioicae (strain p1A1 Lamole / MvSl-1064) TaxID=683840 RepID=U5HC02_USTV1|nr:hypothetical protein MVLG_04692 [Microbotryum lychnidis-dioicae p1A1 Lamole]|eukprot:KDE04936.1 hypothetical protein MVLG_04692 [Microbotryum lychnidis-dioicae p1A1 Lamole]
MARSQASKTTTAKRNRTPSPILAWWITPRNAATRFVALHRPITFALSLAWSLLCFVVSALFSLTHLPPPSSAPALCACRSSPEPRTRPRPGRARRPSPTPILTLSTVAFTSLEMEYNDVPSLTISTPAALSTSANSPVVDRTAAAAKLRSNRLGLLFRRHPRRSGSLPADAVAVNFDRHVLGDVEESEEDYHNRDSMDHSDRYSFSSDRTYDSEDGSDQRSRGPGPMTPDGGASDSDLSEAETTADHAEIPGSSANPKRSNNLMHWLKRRSATKGTRSPSSRKDSLGDGDEDLGAHSQAQKTPSKRNCSNCTHSALPPLIPSLRNYDPHPDSVSFSSSPLSESHVEFLSTRTDSTSTMNSVTSSTSFSASSSEMGSLGVPAHPAALTRRRGLSLLFRRSSSSRSPSPSSKSPLGSPLITPPVSPTFIPSLVSLHKTHPGLVCLDSDVPALQSSAIPTRA